MEVTYSHPYTYMSRRDHSASLSVGHRCLGTLVPDRGLAEVLTSPNKTVSDTSAGDGLMAKGQGARGKPGTMEPRRSTMGSPLTALLIDCAALVLPVSARGGRFWLAA